jgi:type IV secretory pathway VirB4 component
MKPAREQRDRPRLRRDPNTGLVLERSRSTMAHLRSAYPFHADAGFGDRGAFIGANVTGGLSGFYFDPFEFYAERHLTNPNMIVMGSVGFGKSATVKALIRRLRAVYGSQRYLAIIDPKGEYGALADDLGLATVRLMPGGSQCVNPLDPQGEDGGLIERQALVAQLVSGVLRAPLNQVEDAVLGRAIQRQCERGGAFTLREVCAEIAEPADELVAMSRFSPLELTRATSSVTFALDKLCNRTLRGMFDGPTTVRIDWDRGPGVLLDLSAVYSNQEALPLVMVAATHWLAGALRGRGDRQAIQVIDEAWAAIHHGAEYFQSSLKLARAHGVATVLVVHRPSDLTAQSDDGTAASKIAAGLLSDIQTRVLLHQPPEQVDEAARLFDLSEREREWLGTLVQGRAIWKIGPRSALVQTILHPNERALFDTDAAMLGMNSDASA